MPKRLTRVNKLIEFLISISKIKGVVLLVPRCMLLLSTGTGMQAVCMLLDQGRFPQRHMALSALCRRVSLTIHFQLFAATCLVEPVFGACGSMSSFSGILGASNQYGRWVPNQEPAFLDQG